MIIVVETSHKKNTLHFLEFVKPVIDILDTVENTVVIRHFTELTSHDIAEAKRIIICGNGLQDQAFLKASRKFAWLRTVTKPVLGICAGMQMITKVCGGKIKPKTRIGVERLQFLQPDALLGRMSKYDVYSLHNYICSVPPGFVELAETDIPMAIRKADAPVYGVLFHPEVLNKDLIREFARL